MSDIAIKVEGLSKCYNIGKLRGKSTETFGEKISNAMASPFRRAKQLLSGNATGAADLDELFWAMQDVSFEVERGQLVGIIGRNGAGKSTLLKCINRLITPTKGEIVVKDRRILSCSKKELRHNYYCMCLVVYCDCPGSRAKLPARDWAEDENTR